MLTDECLLEEHDHMGGKRRVYDLGNGYGLSAINSTLFHSYPYAWECAILKGRSPVYDTPLTQDVEVFASDEDANEFINKAIAWAKENHNV